MPRIHSDTVDHQPGSRAKVGVDVFIETTDAPDHVASRLQSVTAGAPFALQMLSNRGTQVWPDPGNLPTCVDHYRCRFTFDGSSLWSDEAVLGLLARVGSAYRWMHIEKLEEHDGVATFTRAQGQN